MFLCFIYSFLYSACVTNDIMYMPLFLRYQLQPITSLIKEQFQGCLVYYIAEHWNRFQSLQFRRCPGSRISRCVAYPDVLSLDEHLWHKDIFAAHALSDFGLILAAHEHISFLVFHQESPQDLFHFHAGLVCLSDDAHRRRVYDHLAGVFFFVIL